MTCSISSRPLTEFLQDLLFFSLLAVLLILLAGLGSTICLLLTVLKLLKLLLRKPLNLIKRIWKMNNKLKLSLTLIVPMLIVSALILSGCASNPHLVAAPCPNLPSVPKSLMQPPANSAELAKVLNSTPTP